MKKNLLSVLILVLLLVNIAMSAVMMISVVSTNGKTAKLMDSITLALNLELMSPGSSSDVPLSETASHEMGTQTIPLAFSEVVNADGSVTKDTRQKYLVFNIALQMNTKHDDYATYGASIANYESDIKDVILSVVSQYTEEECRANFSGAIRDEILLALQDLFHSKFIFRISLSDIKYG